MGKYRTRPLSFMLRRLNETVIDLFEHLLYTRYVLLPSCITLPNLQRSPIEETAFYFNLTNEEMRLRNKIKQRVPNPQLERDS